MSRVYSGQLAQALRGASLLPGGQVIIQDEVKATNRPGTVRWAMVTPAEVSIQGKKNALLKKDGKAMRLTVLTDEEIQLRTYSAEPKADYDARNPGTRLVGFEVSLSAGKAARTTAILSPSGVKSQSLLDLKPVLEWSAPR